MLYITKGRANPSVYTWPFPAVQAGTAWVAELQVWNAIGVPVALDGYAFSARICDLRSDHVIATASVDSPGTGRIRWFFEDGALTRFGDDVYRFTLDANVNGATQRLIDSRLPVQGGSVTVDAGDFIEILPPDQGGGGGIIPPPPPTQVKRVVSSMSPTSVSVGVPTLITLVGQNFGATDKVMVGDATVPITPTTRTATLITFMLSAAFPTGSQPVMVVVAPSYRETDALASVPIMLTMSTGVPASIFPDATNTGPTVTLTDVAGDIVTTTAGQVISAKRLTNGKITVLHDNVSIQNCEVNLTAITATAIDADNVHGTLIENTRIIGVGGAQGVIIAYNSTMRRCDVSGFEKGVLFAAGPITIEDNYIHGLALGGFSSEYCCVKTAIASDTTIQRNTLVGREDVQVILKNDYRGISNVRVLNNQFLAEPSMTPPIWNVEVNGQGTSYPVTQIEIAFNTGTKGTLGDFYVTPEIASEVNIHENFSDAGDGGGGGPVIPPDTPLVFDPWTVTAAYMAANTGVKPGTVLRPGPNPSTIQNGAYLEGYEWTDGLTLLNLTNVTLYNCKITGGGWGGLLADTCDGLVVRRCTVIGTPWEGYNGAIVPGVNCTVERCDISVHEHAIVPGGGDSGLIRWNYIHDPYLVGDKHVGGISMKGGGTTAAPYFNNIVVEENFVIGKDTACIFIQDNFGPCKDITVRRNRLSNVSPSEKVGYMCYSESRLGYGTTGTQFLDNVMEKGSFGYFSLSNQPDIVMTGNIDAVTGLPVDGL